MNHEISLTLELADHTAECLCFRLVIHNRSNVRLLLPYPEITDIRFGNKATFQECAGLMSWFQTSEWGGVVLDPDEPKQIQYRVRPCSVGEPSEEDFSDYYRYCVELPAGEYMVWLVTEVKEDYFDSDSHYQLADLKREADAAEAIVWMGQAKSNRLHVVRA